MNNVHWNAVLITKRSCKGQPCRPSSGLSLEFTDVVFCLHNLYLWFGCLGLCTLMGTGSGCSVPFLVCVQVAGGHVQAVREIALIMLRCHIVTDS